VKYSDKFYDDLVCNWPRENDLVRLAYHNESLIGAITGRRETYDPAEPTKVKSILLPTESHKTLEKEHVRVYISTLAVLAPYRRRGAASKLLQAVIDSAKKDGPFDEIYVHVHVDNTSAIELYKKFGFEITDTLTGYYRDITPPDCYFMVKKL